MLDPIEHRASVGQRSTTSRHPIRPDHLGRSIGPRLTQGPFRLLAACLGRMVRLDLRSLRAMYL